MTVPELAPSASKRPRLNGLGAREINLLLEVCILIALGSGFASWWLGDQWSGWAVLAHRIAGLGILVLTPAKFRGPVKSGLRRKQASRSISILFGVVTLATVILGILHATGLWYGVGYWSPLWTHQLFAFLLIPLLSWHLFSRPARPHLIDLDRRAALRGGVMAGAAAGIFLAQEGVTRVFRLAGSDRRSTGSHEIASFNPSAMPSTIWINDSTPESVEPETWQLTVEQQLIAIASLRQRAQPVAATLDCTGGWFSEQAWDALPVSDLLKRPTGRSVRVESATGYSRLFSHHELDNIYLAIGYGGEPLRARHGAPVRLVVPGQRGPMWIKWVTKIESDDRPAWLQPPLPLT